MANGKQILGSDGGGTVSVTVPSGVTTNTTATLQDKSGTIARLEDNGGRKNYLINGNFDMWQRGTSQTIAGYYSDDRWFNDNTGSTKTHSRIACTDTERALFNAQAFSRTVVSSVVGSMNNTYKDQRIEDVTKLSDKTVTLSFWAKANTNKNISVEFMQVFGTGGTPSIQNTDIGVQKFALTTTWQKFTKTVTVPSIVGKTLGTDGVHTSFTLVRFWFDAGSNFNSRTDNLGQQSGTFDIAQVQLEEGSVATDGWHPYDGEFGGEVQACQRYLPVFTRKSTWAGQAYGGNLAGFNISFLSPTRVAPTGVVSNNSFNVSKGDGGTTPVVSFSFTAASTSSANINASLGVSFLTVGQASTLSSVDGTLQFIGCEL